jgi:molecular chaperone GrpE
MNENTKPNENEIAEAAGDERPAQAAQPEDQAGEEPPFARLEAELDKLKQEVLYAQAETQNVRRRLEKEKADATAYAATGFARDMLSVADNLGRALAAIPPSLREDKTIKPLLTGIEMTSKELETVFQRNGISRIEALGQRLDPNRHQAMVELESDAEPGTVVQEMQSGYTIRDRLLRPALVAVAKAPAEPVGNRVDAEA